MEIQEYLEDKNNRFQDWNIPYADGEQLFKLITENNYHSALEIGTSTGYSTIWLAWAMSKTGGKVITIEIDKTRHQKALKHFEEAGVSHLIEAHFGDAQDIIPSLSETFDFIFADATWDTQSKENYLKFFQAVEPKLQVGGMYTMHNVIDGYGDDGRLLAYINKLNNYKTHIIRSSSAGISVSLKS